MSEIILSPNWGGIQAAKLQSRALQEGGTNEPNCMPVRLEELKKLGLYDKASLIWEPQSYKEGKLLSLKPNTSLGDFTFSRASEGSRIGPDGLIQTEAVDVPRLQYPSCPTLLLEPAGTNKSTQSEFQSGWTDYTNALHTPNQTIAPDGTNTGCLCSGTNVVDFFYRSILSLTIDTAYTMSIYTKNVDSTITRFMTASSGIVTVDVTWNGSEIASVSNGGFEYVVDGWYRVWGTGTITTGTSTIFRIYPYYEGSTGFGSCYVWGAVIEEGTYPTSYIKTESAPVVRALETGNISPNTDLIKSSEGTMMMNMFIFNYTAIVNRSFGINDGSTTNRYLITDSSAVGRIIFQPISAYSVVTAMEYVFPVEERNAYHKVAVRWKKDDFSLWADGIKRAESLGNFDTPPDGTFDRLAFNGVSSTSNYYGKNKEILYFNHYLPDEQMADLK